MSLQRTLPPGFPNDPHPEIRDGEVKYDLEKELPDLSDEPRLNADGYETVRKLNDGSSGKIYLLKVKGGEECEDRLVACKVIGKGLVNKHFVKKFLPRELEVVSTLSNPYCIQVHRILETESKCFIFMRYAEKGDLYEYLTSHGRLTEGHARFWIRQLGLAVKYLQSLNIAHRDIKCENILVTEKLNVKLADFGFCRFWTKMDGGAVGGEEQAEVTSETYCGSLHYAAPEILAGLPYRLRYVDVWSLGVVLFVMINGRFPYSAGSIPEIRNQQLAKNLDFKRAAVKSISREAVGVIESLLEPDITKRMTVGSLLNCKWMKTEPRLLEILPENMEVVNVA